MHFKQLCHPLTNRETLLRKVKDICHIIFGMSLFLVCLPDRFAYTVVTVHIYNLVREGGVDWGGGGAFAPPSLYVQRGPGFCMAFINKLV